MTNDLSANNADAVRDRIVELMRADLNARTHDAMSTASYRLLLAVMRDAARELTANLPTDDSPLHDDSYDYVSNPIHTLTVARSILESLENDSMPTAAELTELADDIAPFVIDELASELDDANANATDDERSDELDYIDDLDSVIMLYRD